MSARYPQGIAPAWFPHDLIVYSDESRDVYGRVTADGTERKTKGEVVQRPLEMIEAGVRVKRNGAKIMVAIGYGVNVEIGTIIDWVTEAGSVRFTVVGLTAVADHMGQSHFVTCDCLTKATEA